MRRARTWKVDGASKPRALTTSNVSYERDLEDWIEEDATIAVDDVLIIARQYQTGWGTALDLLGIDGEGNLVVLELKRDQTLRDTIAQAIEYAAWVSRLSVDQILDLASAKFGGQEDFEEAFLEKFNSELPDSLNQSQRILIVAPQVDAVTAAVIDYLSTAYQMPIDAAWFDVFDDGAGGQLLVRQTIVEESQARQRPPTGHRRPTKTLDDMRELAARHGSLEAFDELLTLQDVLPSVFITQSSVNLRRRVSNTRSYLSGIVVYPAPGLHAGAAIGAFAYANFTRLYGIAETEAHAFVTRLSERLPIVRENSVGNWKGWERLEVRTADDARFLTEEFRSFVPARKLTPSD